MAHPQPERTTTHSDRRRPSRCTRPVPRAHPAAQATIHGVTSSPESLFGLLLAALREHRIITFVVADLGGDRCGLVDRQDNVIFLEETNTDGAMRATVAHELHHLVCPQCPEDEIEAMTAEMLVPLSDALAAQAGADVDQIAARLVVDPALIRARMGDLGDVDRAG